MLALDDTRPIQYEGGKYKDVPTYIMGDGRGSISDFVCAENADSVWIESLRSNPHHRIWPGRDVLEPILRFVSQSADALHTEIWQYAGKWAGC